MLRLSALKNVKITFFLKAKTPNKTFYEILNIEKSATEKEIKQAFRARSKESHPDKFQDEEEKKLKSDEFVEITKAYNVLSDKNLKAEYDRKIANRDFSWDDNIAEPQWVGFGS